MIDSLRKWYYLPKHLDTRNRALWQEVSKQYDITIKGGDEPNYKMFTKGKQATIYIPEGGADPAGFAHELLHIYLDSKGIAGRLVLNVCVSKKPKLRTLLSEELLEFLANALDHLKMLPLFLDLGYEPRQFITDYTLDKGSDQLIQPVIKSFLFKGHYSKLAFDAYIGRYFAIIACPNPEHNYGRALEKLKNLDTDLYAILDRFAQNWKALKPAEAGYEQEGRMLIAYPFIEELAEWVADKTFY